MGLEARGVLCRWEEERGDGGRGSQVWQGKDLREGIFGSVAMIRLIGDFSEVWQRQELATFWREPGVGEGGVRSTARRGRMGFSEKAYYTIFDHLSRRK